MNEEFKMILQTWGLENIIPLLEVNGIDNIDILKQLVEDGTELQSVIKNCKDRLILKSKVSEYLKPADRDGEALEQNCQLLFRPSNNTLEETFSLPTTSSVASENGSNFGSTIIESTPLTSFVPSTQDILIVTNLNNNSNENEEEPPVKKNKLNNLNLNLDDLLNETVTGKAIKAHYQLKGSLDSLCQSYLVDIIVQKYLNIQPFRRLTNEDFAALAKEIVQCFPKELQEVYYTPPLRKRQSRDNKSGIARGKLVDKYRNRLTFLRKNGIIKSSKDVSDDDEDNTNRNQDHGTDNLNVNEEILWLKNNDQPWSHVEEKWKKTYTHRQQLLKGDIDIKEFLKIYPIITHKLGYSLIDNDFKEKFKENYQLLFVNFENKFRKLLIVRKSHLSQSDNLLLNIIESQTLSDDSRHYLMFTVITSLLPQRSYPKKFAWKPTASESRDGVVTYVTIPGDIKNVIDQRKELMKKYNLPIQPYVVCEGPTYNNINKFYVSYDTITYEVPSFLKALDVCFQLIHILNLEYPYEAEHIWMFLQIAMYQLTTPYDKLPGILDVVNKVNNIKN